MTMGDFGLHEGEGGNEGSNAPALGKSGERIVLYILLEGPSRVVLFAENRGGMGSNPLARMRGASSFSFSVPMSNQEIRQRYFLI
jgi:hypothetical protein